MGRVGRCGVVCSWSVVVVMAVRCSMHKDSVHLDGVSEG